MLRFLSLLIKLIFFLIGYAKVGRHLDSIDNEENKKMHDEQLQHYVQEFGKFVCKNAGANITFLGQENLPEGEAVTFISNHQSIFDIPVILGMVNKPVAFVSKIEMLKVPVISKWMQRMRCVFMDRKNMRQSLQIINQAAENIKKGYSMLIFPEGTRSRGGPIKPFKQGSLKIALKAESKIVPIVINGTYKLLEGNKKFRLTPADITIKILKPMDVKNMSKDEQNSLANDLYELINSNY